MIVEGHFNKIGKQWSAEIPLIYTLVCAAPGEPKSKAIEKLQNLAKDSQIDVEFNLIDDLNFHLKIPDISKFLPFVLKRAREAKKLSISDVARRLGHSSRNSYAQYEYGKTKVSLEKYIEIMKAIDPRFEILVQKTLH